MNIKSLTSSFAGFFFPLFACSLASFLFSFSLSASSCLIAVKALFLLSLASSELSLLFVNQNQHFVKIKEPNQIKPQVASQY